MKFFLNPGGLVEIVGPGEGRHCRDGMGLMQINFSRSWKKQSPKERNSIILMNTSYSCNYSLDYWDALIHLARKFGWYPQGTIRGREHEMIRFLETGVMVTDQEMRQRIKETTDFERGYYHSANWIITMDDALNIANALDRALEEMKEGEPDVGLYPCSR